MNVRFQNIRLNNPLPLLGVFFVVGLAGLLFPFRLNAQDFQSMIYQAYIEKQMDAWKEVMEQMSNRFASNSDMELLYELAEAEYGYIAYCLSVKKKKEAAWWLDAADRHILKLLDWQKGNPRIWSLKGALTGLRIRLKPTRVVKYAKLSAKANQRAFELGPDEPQAWMEKANIAFYKPAFLGGSKKKAVKLYEKAVHLYEANPERIRKNWLYLNCMVGLGMAYDETGQLQAAGEVYEKLLRIEPSFRWVNEDLYPAILEKQSSN
ncbi:MAG: hypothetical protein ABFS28_01285 [Bacteroidota bacterium]